MPKGFKDAVSHYNLILSSMNESHKILGYFQFSLPLNIAPKQASLNILSLFCLQNFVDIFFTTKS